VCAYSPALSLKKALYKFNLLLLFCNIKNQIAIFYKIIHFFTVTFDQFITSLLNKSILFLMIVNHSFHKKILRIKNCFQH